MEGQLSKSYRGTIEESAIARFMAGVYKWMAIGILLTAFVSYYVSMTPTLLQAIVGNRILFFGLILAELGAVLYLSFAIQRISAMTATVVYLLYSGLTGLTLSVIFLAYTQESIANAFILTTCGFAGLSAFGYVTKKDLGPIGTFCIMGLWGLIGFGIISIFFPALMTETASKVYGLAGVLIFAGLTAYDTQKIKSLYASGSEGTAESHKQTIFGALKLYLDFLNLFLSLLRLMGNRRR